MSRLYILLCLLLCSGILSAQSPDSNSEKITMRGKPVTLLGTKAYVGEAAPDFTGIDGKMKECGCTHPAERFAVCPGTFLCCGRYRPYLYAVGLQGKRVRYELRFSYEGK